MDSGEPKLDLAVLVDIISNLAGMMILLACISLMVRQRAGEAKEAVDDDRPLAKPINFPLAYIPNKRSATICVKYGRIYDLPEKQLLEEVARRTATGETVRRLELKLKDVRAEIELTPTLTGYRFSYWLNPDGGIPAGPSSQLKSFLDKVLTDNPPSLCFYSFYVWPDGFEQFRDIREYLHEQKCEVGWSPRSYRAAEWSREDLPDVGYSIGEYSEDLSSIKAQ